MDPVTETNCPARVIEVITDGSRGAADCILEVPRVNGASEFDLDMAGLFGITPEMDVWYAADLLEEDRFAADGTPNGRSVTVVGLREV